MKLRLFALCLALLAGLSGCGQVPPPEELPSIAPSSSSQEEAPAAGAVPEASPEPSPESSEPASPEPEPLYPVGGIGTSNFVDPERATYDGTMVLEVPRMGFKGVVQDGTSNEILNLGVGLFPEGQLPGTENRNVCIAGHRDIYGKEFWDIDKITDGDLFYLTYQGKRYTYEYLETLITEPDDWQAIRVREFPVLTLQSCDPIMVASHRIFKVGKLISVEDAPDDGQLTVRITS